MAPVDTAMTKEEALLLPPGTKVIADKGDAPGHAFAGEVRGTVLGTKEGGMYVHFQGPEREHAYHHTRVEVAEVEVDEALNRAIQSRKAQARWQA